MKISLSYIPKDSPWGGGNQFALMFKKYFSSRGHNVSHNLERDTDIALLIDPRPAPEKSFIHTDIMRFKKRNNPRLKFVHRVNECDKRKGTGHIDRLLYRANHDADFTIFVSAWLRDYFLKIWKRYDKPHAVINNGADETIFNGKNKKYWDSDTTLSIVTHHWSDNWMKGADIYKRLDDLLSDPWMREKFSFTYIGRHPSELKLNNTKIVEPKHGPELATELRRCHVYLTASRFDPCGMHQIEGALCGLPVIYIDEGGGNVECCRDYGIKFNTVNFTAALFKMREQYFEYAQRLRQYPLSGTYMLQNYEGIFLKLIN